MIEACLLMVLANYDSNQTLRPPPSRVQSCLVAQPKACSALPMFVGFRLGCFCYHPPMLRLVLTLVLILPMSVTMADVTGKPRVIDGDTIEIAGERIRLHGIDAPETKQSCTDMDGREWRCGQDATFALANLIGDHWITCKGGTRDRYGRLIAVCYALSSDLLCSTTIEPSWVALSCRQMKSIASPVRSMPALQCTRTGLERDW